MLKQMLDCNTIEIFQVLNLAVTLLWYTYMLYGLLNFHFHFLK